jgi:hypothetical protein
MSDESSKPDQSTQAIAGFVERYGKRIVSLFGALAGAIGVFHVIGFVIVNVNLLNYGVFEVALPQVGYVAPGVSFVVLVIIMSLTSILLFSLSVRVLTRLGGPLNKTHIPEIIGGLIGFALIGLAAITLSYGLWSLRGFSREVAIFCGAIGVFALVLIFAEDLPMINVVAHRYLKIEAASTEGVWQRLEDRLKSPAFLIAVLIFMFVFAVSYGQSVYDKVPAVFGGGLPTIVRFYGPDVKKLESIGVHTEPGQADLTERVSLIAQSADRYIVLVDRRAISFDQKFVQGIRYELPDFFLDRSFIWQDHTRLADRLAANNDLNGALSEYEFVLNDAADYVPALRGHAQVLLQLDRLILALQDFKALTQLETGNLENFYALATLSEKARERPDSGVSIKVSDVIAPLVTATAGESPYLERARLDETFIPLRGNPEFDQSIYNGGVNAARYFATHARSALASGVVTEAIRSYQWAITYSVLYAGAPNAPSPAALAELHIELGKLYSQRDRFSPDAEAEFLAAVEATQSKNPTYLIALADFYNARNNGPADAANALKYYQAAQDLQIDPKDPNSQQALIGVARALLKNGQPNDLVRASITFSQVLSLSASDPSVWYDYARSLAAQSASDANAVKAALQHALDLDRSYAAQALGPDWSAYFARLDASIGPLLRGTQHNEQGHAYRNQGQLDLAAAEFISATLEDPSLKRYWRDLADTQFQRKQFGEAAVAYQNAIDRSPTIDTVLLTQLALALANNQDNEAAVTAFRAVIDALQGAAPATTYNSLGDALYALKRYDEASAAYAQAASRDTSNLSYAYQQGLSLFKAGQDSTAPAAMAPILKNSYVAVNLPDGVGVRSDINDATILTTVPFGTVLQLTDKPSAPTDSTQYFWPVTFISGDTSITGWVPIDAVVPTAPPTVVTPSQLTQP